MGSTLQRYFCLDNLFLIYNLVLKNLKVRYRGSWLGLFWTTLIPAFTSIVYFFIFKYILKVHIENYLVFIMSGLIPWTFFSQTLSAGLESLVSNHTLLNKVPIPPQSLVLSESYTYLLNLIFSLPVLIVIILLSQVPLSIYMLQYFIFTFLLFILANSASIILSFLYVYFRDLKFMVSIVIQFWFYLTPIMYAKSMIPPQYFNLFYLNPIGIIFISLHESILEPKLIPGAYYLASIGWTLAFLLLSIVVLIKYESEIVESL
jgi:lipopolysaccharide transport system permease protein